MTEAFFVDESASRCVSFSSLSFDDGFFLFGEGELSGGGRVSSSGRKRIFKGVFSFSEGAGGYAVPAIAVYFVSGDPADYVRELQGLTDAGSMGVGPCLIKGNVYRPLPGGEGRLPLVIEEDAGASLEDVLDGAPIPMWNGEQDVTCLNVRELGDDDRNVLSRKIAFDVLSQVSNMHSAGKYHRDIRCANIAIRAYGSRPIDIRATLIDLEFLADSPCGCVVERTYYDPLFRYGEWPGDPSPCEQDAGYLTIVLAEILCLRRFSEEYQPGDSLEVIASRKEQGLSTTLAGLMSAPKAFFVSRDCFARPVGRSDASPYAESLGLPTVDDSYRTASKRSADLAMSLSMHAGYLDIRDIKVIERNPRMKLESQIEERLARQIWANYTKLRRRDGLPVEYDRFEDQPADLQSSNVDQASDMIKKINDLGYEIVLESDCPEERRVRKLSERQIEYLAEVEHDRWWKERIDKGWTLGPRDAQAKTSPYLVPWDELDEQIKDYDRDPVRNLIPMAESAGLVVRK